MKHPSLSLCGLALLAFAAPVFAGTPINETRKVDADARIEVVNVRGAVSVTTWDRDEVAVTGTLGDGSKGLEVDGSGSRLSIRVQSAERSGWGWFGSSGRMEDSILDVKVPRRAELKIEVVSAEVAVSGTEGRLVDVDSVSGRVRVDGKPRELELGSVSGSIEADVTSDRLQAETVSGEIRARGAIQRLKFESVSGSISAQSTGYREFNASSVSGDIAIGGKLADDGRLDSETMSGDVRVQLTADASARIHAETFSGRIRSDVGTVKQPEYGPGRSLDATLGGGAARITIETFSGDIDIRMP